MSITRRLALPSILLVLAGMAGPALAGDAAKEARGIVTSLRSVAGPLRRTLSPVVTKTVANGAAERNPD